ncbi:MAG TPA: LamG domain-containing protein [Myxococcota bacterium]|nr:LamG domain-containing protein [Myxococcota bacterium]
MFSYQYPPGGNYTGVKIYYAAARSDLDTDPNLPWIDLGLLAPDSQGIVNTMVPNWDPSRDYYVALRTYDAQGNESANSNPGVIYRVPPNPALIFGEDFESTAVGRHPAEWVDSAPDTSAPSQGDLFAVVALPDGTHAFEAPGSTGEIQSHLDGDAALLWSSYEYSGRIQSDSLGGAAGVTVLSQYPDSASEYLLERTGAGAYTLAKRGTGALTCATSASTGVVPVAGQWLRFKVRATRFDSDRNRLRATLWADGATEPSTWQADCWDDASESIASGRVGVVSTGDPGNRWDDLSLETVADNSAPPGYTPGGTGGSTGGGTGGSTGGGTGGSTGGGTGGSTGGGTGGSTGGGTTIGYTSAPSLVHWWRPGWDPNDVGRDFAAGGGVDAATNQTGVKAADLVSAGSTASLVDLDGKKEALGNFKLTPYGVGNTWSLAAWVRPAKLPKKAGKPVYVFDLNGARSKKSLSRISLTLDSAGHFGIRVSDAQGRERAVSASSAVSTATLGTAWYHVLAVKSAGTSLSLYVNGVMVASTPVGVPVQTDVPRALRIGGRVKSSQGYYFNGGIASVALWRTALRATEVTALYAGGNNRTGSLQASVVAGR